MFVKMPLDVAIYKMKHHRRMESPLVPAPLTCKCLNTWVSIYFFSTLLDSGLSSKRTYILIGKKKKIVYFINFYINPLDKLELLIYSRALFPSASSSTRFTAITT